MNAAALQPLFGAVMSVRRAEPRHVWREKCRQDGMYAKAHTLDIAVPSDNERALRWSNMLSRTQFSSKIWFTFYARVHHKARLLSGGHGPAAPDSTRTGG